MPAQTERQRRRAQIGQRKPQMQPQPVQFEQLAQMIAMRQPRAVIAVAQQQAVRGQRLDPPFGKPAFTMQMQRLTGDVRCHAVALPGMGKGIAADAIAQRRQRKAGDIGGSAIIGRRAQQRRAAQIKAQDRPAPGRDPQPQRPRAQADRTPRHQRRNPLALRRLSRSTAKSRIAPRTTY